MINIKHILSVTPKYFINLKKNKNFKKVINYSGFEKVHILKDFSTSKLVNFTIKKFFVKTKVLPSKIDSIIYCSHSREYEMPIFSASIQKKFGFKKSILCYDLPNSCSGFTNSLLHSYSLIKSGLVKNTLVICADTHSKIAKSKNLRPIIGDACACFLVEKNSKNPFHFDFGTDGNENNALRISNNKSQKNLYMDGLKVLEFAITNVPKSVSRVIKKSKIKTSKIDYFSFHQPNKSMHDHILRKIGVDMKKVVSTFKYGNTSAPSIPLSLSEKFKNKKLNNKIFLFCGFGAGFQWSTILTKLNKSFIHKIYYL